MIIWKPVLGYESEYAISNTGKLKSLDRYSIDGKHLKEKILSGGLYGNGYHFYCLRKNNTSKNKLTHRLVAEAFIPNPMNYPVVNHIDGDIWNNNVENLEWCTQGYNLKHAVDIGLMESQCKIRRKVTIFSNEGDIEKFDDMKSCCEFFGHTKCWLGNKIKQVGNPFIYDGWTVLVHERGM